MRFQALLLSLVILTSLLLSPSGKFSDQLSDAKERRGAAAESAPAPSRQETKFWGNLYSAFSEKADFIGQDLAFAGTNFNRNLAAAKEIYSYNLRGFFINRPEPNAETDANENVLRSAPFSAVSAPAVISEVKINAPKVSICNSEPPNLKGRIALIKYGEQIFFEFNPKQRWPVASLTKLMTAVVAREKMDLNKEIIMSAGAVVTEGVAGNFIAGDIFKLKDLIKAVLIASSNDAAAAIAEDFGERSFVDEMQKKAAELQMFSSAYLEPTGLSFVNQSTAADLAKLMRYIYLNHSEILEISRQKEAEVVELKSRAKRKLLNVNKFAGEPDFIGGKTGYIDEAGRNLIALFNMDDGIILTIVLGAEDSFAETEKMKTFAQTCI